MSQSSSFLNSSFDASRPSLYTSIYPTMWVPLSPAVPQGHICASTTLSPVYWYTYSFWQVQASYTKSQLDHFLVIQWAIQTYDFVLISFLKLPHMSKCSSPSTLSLNARLAFSLYTSFFLRLSFISLFFPISFHPLSTALPYFIPARFLVTLSHAALLATAGDHFWHTPYLYFNVLASSFV